MSPRQQTPPARGAGGVAIDPGQGRLPDYGRHLRQFAMQYRVRAVDAIEAGDFDQAERCEATADRLYARARTGGDTGYQLPRVRADQTLQARICIVCRKRFRSDRATAKYCSRRCEARAYRLRDREPSDRVAKGGKTPGQGVGK